MTDRELLELAAKAAGIEIGWIDPVWNDPAAIPYIHLPGGKLWNPLTDDGDALRLTVKLHLTPHFYREHGTTYVATDAVADPEGFDCLEHWGADPYAATRRALVRAAAEIGKGIK